MFNCDTCGTPVGPGIKPIVFVVERPATYINKNIDGAEVVTHGTEIEREIKECAKCAADVVEHN